MKLVEPSNKAVMVKIKGSLYPHLRQNPFLYRHRVTTDLARFTILLTITEAGMFYMVKNPVSQIFLQFQ